MRARTRGWFRFLSFALLLIAGCSRQAPKVQVEKTRPLPEISASDQNFSSYRPENGFSEISPSALMRTAFQAPGPPGYRVEVRDIQIAPHKKSADLTLPGAAFAEVRYGAGTIAIGDKRQELALGSTMAISQGQHFSLESGSDQPLILRVHLLAAD